MSLSPAGGAPKVPVLQPAEPTTEREPVFAGTPALAFA
jgi:hypothetical protein